MVAREAGPAFGRRLHDGAEAGDRDPVFGLAPCELAERARVPKGQGLTFCGGLGGAGDAVEPDCSSLGSTRRHGPLAISGLILSKALHEFSVYLQS